MRNFFSVALLMVASAMSANAFYLNVPLQDFTSAVAPAVKSPLADATFARASEANFCPRVDLIGAHYWCYNAMVKPTLQSLSFDVEVPVDGDYYFGVMYSATAPSTMQVTVDSQGVFGTLATPVTASWNAVKIGLAAQPATLLAGVHSLTLTVTAGGYHAFSLVLSSEPAVAPTDITLPVGAVKVETSTFTTATGPVSLLADKTFARADVSNFCQNTADPTKYDWCMNSPSGGLTSSLTFDVNVPTAGVYYIGVHYAAKNESAVSVAVDGVYGSFGIVSTPPTNGQYAFGLAVGSLAASIKTAGVHQITIQVLKSSLRVDYFVVSPTKLNAFSPIYTPSVVPTAAPTAATTIATVATSVATSVEVEVTTDAQVDIATTIPVIDQANLPNNKAADSTLSTGAIVGIVVGGVVFLVLVIVAVVVLTRKNKSAAKSDDKAVVAKTSTPAVKKMADQ